MNITTGLMLLLVLIVAAIVVDRRRKGQKPSGPYQGPTAAEQEPTETGRYKVKQMLAKTAQPETKTISRDEEGEPLPDPFNKPKN